MIPTLEFRWNKRPEIEGPTFWEMTAFGGGKHPRPVGFRLEQKWVYDEYCREDMAEWRPVPFVEECLDAVPELDKMDMNFLPVATKPPS